VRLRAVFIMALIAVSLTSCGWTSRDTDPYRPPLAEASGDDGKTLYSRDCAWCHASDGSGTSNGPDLVSGTNGPALTDFVLRTGRMPLDDPDERSARGNASYTDEEIEAIVEHTRTFDSAGPDIPTIDEHIGATPEGAELYLENCGACHAPTGVGAAITSGKEDESFPTDIIAPSLLDSTRIEVAEAIRSGPGTMPVFGDGTFTDEEVNEIVGYVTYLSDPDDRGGAPIGRIGPVAEGAVGWLVGVVLVIILIRWMGTKAGEE
jgi:ubiquinol-cytochrome c reductase cytochrome c subunit